MDQAALHEIPELYPVTRQVTAQDALRDKIIELEDLLRGLLGLVDTIAASPFAQRYGLSEPMRSSSAYRAAVEVLK